MFEPIDPHPTQRVSRAFQLGLAMIFALIAVGFIVGLRQGTPIPELAPPAMGHHSSSADADTLISTAYRDFDRHVFGPNRNWTTSLEDLRQPAPPSEAFDSPARLHEARQEFLARRLNRRAFDGAPPVVPHPMDQMTSASCLVCHGEGFYVGKGVWAPPMSHPNYPNCTQCHVEMNSTEASPWITTTNDFQGRGNPGPGSRAWDGAPPTIPHTTFMRENCLSCHGPRGANPLRTSHPWRVACTQCHAPSAELDQVFTASSLEGGPVTSEAR